jgi:hypothetical protein
VIGLGVSERGLAHHGSLRGLAPSGNISRSARVDHILGIQPDGTIRPIPFPGAAQISEPEPT